MQIASNSVIRFYIKNSNFIIERMLSSNAMHRKCNIDYKNIAIFNTYAMRVERVRHTHVIIMYTHLC